MARFSDRSTRSCALICALIAGFGAACSSGDDYRGWTPKNSGATAGSTGPFVTPPTGSAPQAGASATRGQGGSGSVGNPITGNGGSGNPATTAGSGAPGNAGNSASAAAMGGTLSAGGSSAAGSGAPGMDAGSMQPTDPNAPTIGSGDIAKPAIGPAPERAGDVGGGAFTLVKNWDFGTSGTVGDQDTLIAEFQFHDQFGTIANGTNYGSVTVAPTAETAINANNLGLPNNKQPIEQAGRPYREFTAESLKAYVRPLSASATNVSVSAHDTGNGSITAKWKLPNGGSLLGKDLLWETRARMPKPAKAYWYAIWTAGNQWNNGAEMDVLESFGSSNVYPPAAAYHVNSVGGSDKYDYKSWPDTLNTAKVPMADRDLTAWHVWTWLYLKNDTYKVYMDGYEVQSGTIHWTNGGGQGGQSIDMSFLFDFGWGHTQISSVNISLPASDFPIEYEVDYSRVYLR